MAAVTTCDTQNALMMKKLTTFYGRNDHANLRRVLPIINGASPLSLRLIDWFVTNYAKENFTRYRLGTSRFTVWEEYRLRLRSYKKERFDPFCRWQRVDVPFENGTYVETTVGQLNFFMWAIQKKVIDYIEQNRATIEADMSRRNSTARNKPATEGSSRTRRRRHELSISATKTVRKEEVEITVHFGT
jgi:hypothetical protein